MAIATDSNSPYASTIALKNNNLQQLEESKSSGSRAHGELSESEKYLGGMRDNLLV